MENFERQREAKLQKFAQEVKENVKKIETDREEKYKSLQEVSSCPHFFPSFENFYIFCLFTLTDGFVVCLLFSLIQEL